MGKEKLSEPQKEVIGIPHENNGRQFLLIEVPEKSSDIQYHQIEGEKSCITLYEAGYGTRTYHLPAGYKSPKMIKEMTIGEMKTIVKEHGDSKASGYLNYITNSICSPGESLTSLLTLHKLNIKTTLIINKTVDLMISRVEVVGYFPFSKFKIGEILIETKFEDNIYFMRQGALPSDEAVCLEEMEKSPLIFRKLSWYEKRDSGDMPEYVRCDKINIEGHVMPVISNVKWFYDYFLDKTFYLEVINVHGKKKFSARHFMPATREDYETYVQYETYIENNYISSRFSDGQKPKT